MYDTYVVMENDTLDSISNKFNIPVDILKQFNGYNLDLTPGLKLVVPRINNKYFSYYVIKKGDTLYKIASDNSINPTLLAELNGINPDDYIYPNQILLVPKAGIILYFTGVGDTLSGVAQGFKTSIANLVSENENIYLQPEQLIVYKNK